MSIAISSYINAIESHFEANRNESNAIAMEKYMKNKFPFYGIKAQVRREILRTLKNGDKKHLADNHRELVVECLNQTEREWHQLAVDILIAHSKLHTSDDVPLFENCILSHSWWDTVDMIATNVVGPLFARNNAMIERYIPKWRDNPNLWLNRTTILFQLHYKEKLETDLLLELIEHFHLSNEFFIQKAIGWALRHYSRLDEQFVINVTNNFPLKPLSKREALRLINKKKA